MVSLKEKREVHIMDFRLAKGGLIIGRFLYQVLLIIIIALVLLGHTQV